MSRVSGEDVKAIVDVVGREGAIAALSDSKKIAAQELGEIAKSLGLKPISRDSKREIASRWDVTKTNWSNY